MERDFFVKIIAERNVVDLLQMERDFVLKIIAERNVFDPLQTEDIGRQKSRRPI
jgi:hypothetical protein